MAHLLTLCLFVFCFKIAAFTDPEGGCLIELQCEECIPENMPLVTSHRAANGSVALRHGDELRLWCGAGHFLAFRRPALAATCLAGRYRVHDGQLYHLLELGCQESVFEDVLHPVEQCGAPLQGRAYLVRGERGVRHLAAACVDVDRALAVRAQLLPGGGPLAPPQGPGAPLSLLGSFNHLFDSRTRAAADALHADHARATRRLRRLFAADRVTLGGLAVDTGQLLAPAYFEEQDSRAAAFASNKFVTWSSVAAGNLRHLQADVARLVRGARARGRPLAVWAGTRGAAALRAGGARRPVALGAAGRFPAPRYVWTALAAGRRGLALVLLNEPLVAVSEVRAAVFCDSRCARVPWLTELLRNRNYESPALGLVFCCGLHNFTDVVTELPKALVAAVDPGEEGLLTDLV